MEILLQKTSSLIHGYKTRQKYNCLTVNLQAIVLNGVLNMPIVEVPLMQGILPAQK